MLALYKRRKFFSAVAGLLMVLAMAVWARAYVLPAPHVLDLMIENLGSARAMEISQKNILLDLTGQSPPCAENDVNCSQLTASSQQTTEMTTSSKPVTIQEIVRYSFPQSFRSDIAAPPADRTHIYTIGRFATVVDGTISNEPESPFDYYKHLLLHRSRNAFRVRLSERGVNTAVTSLGRFDGRIAFVLGAVYPDNTVPQVWIDKETLRPSRWIVRGAAEGEDSPQFEIRYHEWRRISHVWYPDQIEFVRNGTPVRLIQVEDIIVDPPLTQDMFSVDGLLARSQPAQAPSETEGREEDMSDIQKTIEEFKRLFE